MKASTASIISALFEEPRTMEDVYRLIRRAALCGGKNTSIVLSKTGKDSTRIIVIADKLIDKAIVQLSVSSLRLRIY